MDWLQVFTIAGSTIGACWFMHRESLGWWKSTNEKFEKETKDFHGRLCRLEEKYIQMMERFMKKKEK
jgi:hypothetical protein